jgi:hypothetical protein
MQYSNSLCILTASHCIWNLATGPAPQAPTLDYLLSVFGDWPVNVVVVRDDGHCMGAVVQLDEKFNDFALSVYSWPNGSSVPVSPAPFQNRGEQVCSGSNVLLDTSLSRASHAGEPEVRVKRPHTEPKAGCAGHEFTHLT